jgi:hypothetical protein
MTRVSPVVLFINLYLIPLQTPLKASGHGFSILRSWRKRSFLLNPATPGHRTRSSFPNKPAAAQHTMPPSAFYVDLGSQVLQRLEKFATDEYVIAFGPDQKQFVGTPNGYLA